MNIVFYCQNCGARFDVDARAAGKHGRCKQCGQKMVVPQAGSLASLAAAPHLALAATAAARGKPAEAAAGAVDWLAQVNSRTELAPLTVEKMPALRRPAPRPTPLDDDLGDSKPYALVEPRKVRRAASPSGGPAGETRILWWRWLGRIQRAFRWINETAYLVSVPFIMLILMGAMMHNRPMALAGAAVVVALNLARLVSGLANIVVIPFRESPLRGIVFLIPPFTFFYMSSHWNKFRRPVARVAGPLLTLALVVLAFMFMPSLSGRKVGADDLKGRLESSVEEIGRAVETKADRLREAKKSIRGQAAPAR